MAYAELIELDHKGSIQFHIHSYDQCKPLITKKDIDWKCRYGCPTRVMITGATQETFEYFMSRYAASVTYLTLVSCVKIDDFSLFSDFPALQYIDIYRNHRVSHLWDLSKNTALTGLRLMDFTRLHSLDGVQAAPDLKYLYFGDSMWTTSTLTDAVCLKETRLEHFTFWGKCIEQYDILDFAQIPTLKKFDFRVNQFTTEEVARLAAHAPYLTGDALCPSVYFHEPRPNDMIGNVSIVGKRKPTLFSDKDAERIEKYEKKFWQLVEKYRSEIQ